MFNAFIMLYFTQILGLSGTLAGMAIMLAMIGDAISDPVVGIWSDRLKSRHGRRHPFLWVAPVPLAISVYLIFNPPAMLIEAGVAPEGWKAYGLFAWLSLWTIISRCCLTLYSVPHLALGAEMTSEHGQRSQLFSANFIIGYFGGAMFALLVYGVLFRGERVRGFDGKLVPGHLDPAAYGPVLLLAGALIIIMIWLSAAGTYKYRVRSDENTAESSAEAKGRLSIGDFFGALLSAFQNRNYRLVLFGYFFFMIASGIYDTLDTYMHTYFWLLQPEQMALFRPAGAPAAILGAVLAPILMHIFDRKPVLLGALIGVFFFAQFAVDLRLLGIMPENGSPQLLPLLIANAMGFAFCLGVGGVAIMSMIGDIIDEDTLRTGERQEGLFYSARAFFAKAANSFGHFFAGVMLDVFVRLEAQAVPSEVSPDVLVRLGVLAGPVMALSGLTALVFYWQYNLPKTRHAEVLEELKRRNLTET